MKVARIAFLLTLLIPINGIIHTEFPAYVVDDPAIMFKSAGRIITAIAVFLLVAYLIKRFGGRVIKIASTAILLMLPFALLTFGQVALQLARFSDKAPTAPVSVTMAEAPRVVWLVFDEVDQRIAFAARPPSLKMPEMDRLRGESIYASNAYPPAGQTLLSLPALITGRFVSSAEAVNPSELMIKFEDSEQPVGWSTQPNIFSSARELGVKTALMGWYHPYCRIIGENLDTCFFYDVRKRTLSAVLLNQVRTLVNTVPFVSSLDVVNNSSFGLLTKPGCMRLAQ